jgi:hypothetical protein
MHQHDYQMEFYGKGLDYRFVCACGDVAPDAETAIKRMNASRISIASKPSIWKRIKNWLNARQGLDN